VTSRDVPAGDASHRADDTALEAGVGRLRNGAEPPVEDAVPPPTNLEDRAS
jgi:hypothetical protein